MAAQVVQISGVADSQTSGALACTFPQSTTSGNLLVALAFDFSSVPTVQAGWTSIATKSTVEDDIACAYAYVSSIGAGTSYTPYQMGSFGTVAVWEISGIPASAPVDIEALVETSGKLPTATVTGTTTATDLLLAGLAVYNGSSTPEVTATTPTGFTSDAAATGQSGSGSHNTYSYCHQANVAAGAQSVTWPLSGGVVGNTYYADMALIAIKGVGGTTYPSTLTAGLSFAGAQQNLIRHLLTASLSFVGNFAKRTQHGFTAGVSFVGTLTHSVSHAFISSVSFAGTLTSTLLKIMAFTAGVSFVSAQNKATSIVQSASMTLSGALSKMAQKVQSASVTFSGALSTIKVFLVNLTAGLSFVGSQGKAISKAITSVLSFLGVLPLGSLNASPSSLTFYRGDPPRTLTISGGIEPYSLTSGPDARIAIATLNGVQLMVEAIYPQGLVSAEEAFGSDAVVQSLYSGSTAVIVADSTGDNSVTVPITVLGRQAGSHRGFLWRAIP